MNPTVVDMIMQDHREQERVLRDLLHQPARRRGLVPLLVVLLASHCRTEEIVVYPMLVKAGYDGLIKQCQFEHLNSDRLLDVLVATPPGDDTFETHLRSLSDAVTRHHEREELELLVPLRERLDSEQLDELTDTFAEQRALLMVGAGGLSRRLLQHQAVNVGISSPEGLPGLEDAVARQANTSGPISTAERPGLGPSVPK